ncbi:MAG TPA: lipase family protein, partial [Kofleriaceae bacterium]|nr:lipase family protein [Kofleriaceae bacterium]
AIAAVVPAGVAIDNGYAVHEIRFTTDGAESWATVAIPLGAPPGGGWHIVAGNFGARGLIGVAVDYPGLGTPGLHPYLVARSEGAAVLDGLRAARALADTLGVPTSGRYAIAGLSQGGHATLAAAALHGSYAPELDLRAVAVAAPASGWHRHWGPVAATPGWHLPLHAMLLHAWAEHYHWPATPARFTDDVAGRIGAIVRERCTYAAAKPAIQDSLPQDPAALFDPAFLAEYNSGHWQRYGFVRDAFTANAIAPYHQTAPLRIYQGDADAVVPAWATAELVAALRAGGVDVDYVVVPGGGHEDIAFGFVASPQRRTAESIAWLRANLDR